MNYSINQLKRTIASVTQPYRRRETSKCKETSKIFFNKLNEFKKLCQNYDIKNQLKENRKIKKKIKRKGYTKPIRETIKSRKIEADTNFKRISELENELSKAYKETIITNTKHAKTHASKTTITNLEGIFKALHNIPNESDKKKVHEIIYEATNDLFEISETWQINEGRDKNKDIENIESNEYILDKKYDYYNFLIQEKNKLETELKDKSKGKNKKKSVSFVKKRNNLILINNKQITL